MILTCMLNPTFFFHPFAEEECYSCVSWMISSKTVKFITQTKLHFETIWRTSMVLSRKHVVTILLAVQNKGCCSFLTRRFVVLAEIVCIFHRQANRWQQRNWIDPFAMAKLHLQRAAVSAFGYYSSHFWFLHIQENVINYFIIYWHLGSCDGLFYMRGSQSNVPSLDGYSFAIPPPSDFVTCRFKYVINSTSIPRLESKLDWLFVWY